MWDDRYNTDAYVYGTAPNAFLREHVGRLPRGRVLCLAEGEGRNAVFLAEQGFAVVGIDASRVGLDKAKRLAVEKGVHIETVVGDLGTFDPGKAAWDAVVSIFCHLPKDIRSSLHARVVQGLKPGGIFLLEAYTPRQLQFRTGGPSNEALLVSLRDLNVELAGLRFLHAAEIDREVIEGTLHTGMAAVVQLLAEKAPDA